jgi:phosphoribosylformylglycinamidine synthase
MKKNKAVVFIRLKDGVLDPQGKTIASAMRNMGYEEFSDVRSGRFFELEYNPGPEAEKRLQEVCRKLLANPVIEDFTVEKVTE